MAWIPAAISAGGALVGAFSKHEAAGEAEEAAEAQIAEQRRQFALARQFLGPFQQAGQFAIPGLEGLSQQDPTSEINRILGQFQQSPAQKFVQQRATQGVQSQAERLGLLDSGAERGALAQTISGLAGQNQQQFLQNVLGERARRTQILQNLFGTGAQSAQALAGGALQTGRGVAGSLGAEGVAGALGTLGIGNMAGSLADIFGVGGPGARSFGGLPANQWRNPDTGEIENIGT